MRLTSGQRVLLQAVSEHDGQWNDYKLGRYSMKLLDSPADFNLCPLLDTGYLEEKQVDGEPLPRLYLTDAGRVALAASQPVFHEPPT